MTAKAVFSAIAWAAALGLIVALLGGESRVVSIELWLAGFGIWFAVVIFAQMLKLAPTPAARVIGLWPRPHRKKPTTTEPRNRAVNNVEGLILRSRDNERSFTKQLRPRLAALAAHNLSTHRGINMADEPERAAEVLGDQAWLLDASIEDRCPTLDELQLFFDRISPNHASGAYE